MSKKGYPRSLVDELAENLPEDLIKYYEANVNTNSAFPKQLIEVVEEAVYEDLKEETNQSELRKIYRSKKKSAGTKKKRYYENCKNMVELEYWRDDDIDKYCFKDIAYNHKYFNKEQWDAAYQGMSFEEIQTKELEAIKEWAENSNTKISAYKGREKRTPKSIYSNFKQDITLSILKYMDEKYDFNIESFAITVMDDLSDKSMFGNTKEKIKKDNDKLGHLIVFGDEEGDRRTHITFSEDLFGEEEEIKGFDVKDQEILSYLLQIAEKYEGTEYPIYVETANIAHAIQKNPKRKLSKSDYEDVIKRVRKLTANIDYYENGDWKKAIHLLDYAEHENEQGKDYIAFTPSPYTTGEIQNHRTTRLPAKERNQLTNNTAKLLFYTFLTQRVKAYKKCKDLNKQNEAYIVNYQYAHFLRFVNFGKGNKDNNHKEIIAALEDYKQKGIYINDYKYDRAKKIYAIEFMPLTEREIQDLNYYLSEEYRIDETETAIQLTIFDFDQ